MAIQKITASVLANNAVTAANVAAGALSAADIADNSITAAKLSTSTFAIDSLTVNTSDLVVDTANSRVGISKNNPAYALDIDAVSSSVQIQIGRTTTNTGSTWMGTDGSGFYLGVGAYGSGNSAGDPNGFTVDTSGNVGIGQSSPQARLHVSNATTNNGTIHLGSATYYGLIEHEAVVTGSNKYTVASASGGGHIWYRGSTEQMRIDSSGNVGIGVTPTDYFPGGDNLVVGTGTGEGGITLASSATNQWNYILFADGTSGDAQYRGQVAYNHSTDQLALTASGDVTILTGSGRSEKMRIDSSGDVQIGGVNHQSLSGSARELTIGTTGDTANDGGGVAFTHNSVLGSYVLGQKQAMTIAHYIDGSPIYFRTNSGGTHDTRMTITSSGNVGIGELNPAVSLDIGSKTDAIKVPNGTTAQRPTGAAGHIRYNTTTDKYEVYDYGASEWVDLKTNPSISFVNPTTYFTTRFAISADGQSADADNSSGYGVVSTNINFEGNFTLITKWAHDYMGIGIAYKAGITNSNFTGESADNAGPYGGGANVDGFDSTVSYMGQYHWPVTNGGNDDHLTTWYIKHQRSGNTISTHYSTNSSSADDPAHSSWTQVQSATISSSDHCKPVWGEASANENQILTFTYKDVTGGYNFS